MGREARLNQERRQASFKRRAYLLTIPVRFLKGISGLVGFAFVVAYLCFKEGKWVWQIND